MESAFDYFRSASFEVCSRRTILDVPLEIAEPVCLKKVRLGRKGEAKSKWGTIYHLIIYTKDLMQIFKNHIVSPAHFPNFCEEC